MQTFEEIVLTLKSFWKEKGCLIMEPYDLEMGAGTFHPETFFRAIGPEPYRMSCIQPCRRPADGRYGENPNRLQRYYQFQVLIKPSVKTLVTDYLQSLTALGIDSQKHDVRFVHDDWKSPTLGAWGLGWEVWLDGMEVSQFTYFQQVGGIELNPITAEITYGLERLAMYIQNVERVYDLKYNGEISYGDVFLQNEVQFSKYNFEVADIQGIKGEYEEHYEEAGRCLRQSLVLVAYDHLIRCSHLFNLLDARGTISTTARAKYIQEIRQKAVEIAKAHYAQREEAGFPLLKNLPPDNVHMETR